MRDYVALIGLSLRFLCLVIFVSQKCTDMLFFVCLVVYPIVYPFSGSSRRCYCWRMKMISAGAGFLPRNCCILRPSIFRYFMIIYLFFDIHHHSFPLKEKHIWVLIISLFLCIFHLISPKKESNLTPKWFMSKPLTQFPKTQCSRVFFQQIFLAIAVYQVWTFPSNKI